MNSREIEDLMRRARPAQSPPSAFHEAGQALMEEIMSSPAEEEATASDVTPLRLNKFKASRGRWLVGAAAAVALAIAVPVLFFQGEEEKPATPASTLPQQTLPADGNPYLSIEDDGWRLMSLYQGAGVDGAQTFTSGAGQTLTITWGPMSAYENILARNKAEMTEQSELTMFGQKSLLLGNFRTFEAFVPSGEAFVELRLDGAQSREDFLAVAGQLQVLPPEQWEKALGEGFVTPATSAAVVKEMLTGVPLPPGFDTSVLNAEKSEDRLNFGGTLVKHVTCAWLREYQQARADQDKKGMAAVATALNGNDDWAVTQELKRDPNFSSDVYIVAAKVNTRQDVTEYMEQLGCDVLYQ